MTVYIQQAIHASALHIAQGLVLGGGVVALFFIVLGLALWANR